MSGFVIGCEVILSRITDGFTFKGELVKVTPTGRFVVKTTRGTLTFRADGTGITDDHVRLDLDSAETESEEIELIKREFKMANAKTITFKEFKSRMSAIGLTTRLEKNARYRFVRIFKANGDTLNVSAVFAQKDFDDYAEYFAMKEDAVKIAEGYLF